MTKKLTLLALLFFLMNEVHSQQHSFKDLLKAFTLVDLPLCIEYSEEDLQYDNMEFHLSETVADSVAIEEEHDTIADKITFEVAVSQRISEQAITDHNALADLKKSITNTFLEEFGDSISFSLFPLNLFFQSAKLCGLTIEAQYIDPSLGLTASKRYALVFGKNGKLLSWLEIASFSHRGNFAHHNVRIPWFEKTTSCISKDLIITLEETAKYRIEENGKIIALKD